MPEQAAQTLASRAGVDLAAGVSEAGADNRREGLGAVMGFLTGLGIGAVYGLARPLAPNVSPPVAAIALGLGAMVATDGVSTLLGHADPREWSASDWASDIVPHLAFGAATVAGYEGFGD